MMRAGAREVLVLQGLDGFRDGALRHGPQREYLILQPVQVVLELFPRHDSSLAIAALRTAIPAAALIALRLPESPRNIIFGPLVPRAGENLLGGAELRQDARPAARSARRSPSGRRRAPPAACCASR